LPRILNTDNVSKGAVAFGLEIMKVLINEARKNKNHVLNCDALILLQHEIHDAETGRASNKYCCNDCKEFTTLEITHFGKISGSCQSGSDIPIASDPACKHFKLKEG